MKPFVATLFAVVVIGSAAPASAQYLTEGLRRNAEAVAADVATTTVSTTVLNLPVAKKRPHGLLALYVSYGALQMADAGTTVKALGMGGTEGNSIMQGVAQRPVALFSLKAAVAASTIIGSERLWRQGKRKTAVLMMVGGNLLVGFVVNHNRQMINKLSGRR